MELSTTTVHGEPKQNSCETLTALACSCLLSLVIARGDTGKLLAAIAAALMSPAILGSQEIKVGVSSLLVHVSLFYLLPLREYRGTFV